VLADHHGAVCRRLAGPPERRFTGLALSATEFGSVTLDDGLARFDCSVYREVEAGDHVIVLLRLHSVEQGGRSGPLVFHRSGFSRLAGEA
jgi:flavin reductase (DIM6/NTAB) family NADH-FMN oxidoreductase RutF